MYKPVTKKELQYLIYSKNIPLNKINTSLITDMSDLLKDKNFSRQDGTISNWDVSNVTNMHNMFSGSEFNQDISNWNVSNVTDMSFMFYQSNFNQDISNWNVSNITDMSYMFGGTPFNQNISEWDVSNVTNMSDMFNCSKFNKDISEWDVKNSKRFKRMFAFSRITKVQIFKNMNTFSNDMYNGSPAEDEWKEILKIVL